MQSNNPVQSEPVGRYAAYGKHIGQELQDLPPKMAVYCKKIINEAIYHAQLGDLTIHSRVVNEAESAFHHTNILEPINYPSTSTPSLSATTASEYYSQYPPHI